MDFCKPTRDKGNYSIAEGVKYSEYFKFDDYRSNARRLVPSLPFVAKGKNMSVGLLLSSHSRAWLDCASLRPFKI